MILLGHARDKKASDEASSFNSLFGDDPFGTVRRVIDVPIAEGFNSLFADDPFGTLQPHRRRRPAETFQFALWR